MPQKKKIDRRQFSREAVREFSKKERKSIDDIVCPDLPGEMCEMKFRVKEPLASDLLRLMTECDVYGEVGPSVALIAACMVDASGRAVFVTPDEAVNFLQAHKTGLEPILDAIQEVVGDSVALDSGEPEEGDPLD